MAKPSTKLRHKKMARCAFRSFWRVRYWRAAITASDWVGPFANWHREFRSIKP